MIRAAVSAAWKEAFPDLAFAWDTLRPIQKADMGRLALLYLHGGFYFDLDVTHDKDTDLCESDNDFEFAACVSLHDALPIIAVSQYYRTLIAFMQPSFWKQLNSIQ